MSRLQEEIRQEPATNDQLQPATKPAEAAEATTGAIQDDEPIAPLRAVRAQVEIKAIMAALKHTGWNRKQAARLLKISYRGLLYKIRRHHITAA